MALVLFQCTCNNVPFCKQTRLITSYIFKCMNPLGLSLTLILFVGAVSAESFWGGGQFREWSNSEVFTALLYIVAWITISWRNLYPRDAHIFLIGCAWKLNVSAWIHKPFGSCALAPYRFNRNIILHNPSQSHRSFQNCAKPPCDLGETLESYLHDVEKCCWKEGC